MMTPPETSTLKQCRVRSMFVARNNGYQVEIVRGLLNDETQQLHGALSGSRGIVVVTPAVSRLYGQPLMRKLADCGLDYTLLVVECDEDTKSLEQVQSICDAALDRRLERDSVLVAFGGGVCSDMVTVAASLYRRGVRTLRIPTTLIGQVDAAIGIKGAVNRGAKKSALGCFHAPSHVFIDPAFLTTLPDRHLRGGLAEIVKIALIRDGELFDVVEKCGVMLARDGQSWSLPVAHDIIWRAVSGMLDELEPNAFENRSFKRAVDFGHSFSPSVEAKSGYSVAHGEAVAIDMVLSGAIAVVLGLLEKQEWRRYTTVLRDIGLPTRSVLLDTDAQRHALVEMARHRGGQPNLVVPTSIGAVTILEDMGVFSDALLRQASELAMAEAVR